MTEPTRIHVDFRNYIGTLEIGDQICGVRSDNGRPTAIEVYRSNDLALRFTPSDWELIIASLLERAGTDGYSTREARRMQYIATSIARAHTHDAARKLA